MVCLITHLLALADADTNMPAFGITASAVTNGNEVDVITFKIKVLTPLCFLLVMYCM